MNIMSVVVDNHIGGIQNRIINVGERLKEENISVTILTPPGNGNFSNYAKEKGFNCHEAFIESPKNFNSVENVWKNVLWFLYFPRAVYHIYGIIKKDKIDIVHLNGVLSLQSALAAKIARKPIVWHLISSLYPNLLIFLLRPIFKFFSSKMIFVSYNSLNYYLGNRYDENKVKIIFEPVDTGFFDPKNVKAPVVTDLRLKLGISDKDYVVGFVGNINPIKRIENIIEIAYEIKKTSKNVKFLIIGEELKYHKKYLKYLKNKVSNLNLKNEVIFTGKMSTSNIRDLLSFMNVFLMTSEAEGTPIVILEAMSMKIPVISTNVGGISEQVINGSTGYLFDYSKKGEIVYTLKLLLENKQMRIIMGETGRKRVVKLFSLGKCVNEHKILYQSLVDAEI